MVCTVAFLIGRSPRHAAVARAPYGVIVIDGSTIEYESPSV